jgi:hypothetical protein
MAAYTLSCCGKVGDSGLTVNVHNHCRGRTGGGEYSALDDKLDLHLLIVAFEWHGEGENATISAVRHWC